MPIVRSSIRKSSLCSVILFIIFCSAVFVLCINNEIFSQVLDFRDRRSLLLLCFGVVTIISLSSIISVLLLFGFEDFLNGKNSNVFKRVCEYMMAHEYLCISVCVDVVCYISCIYVGLQLNLTHFLVIISASILFACIIVWTDYDDVDLSSSQNVEKSIGATWAHGAYSAFYKKILVDITLRMSEFEEKNGITLLVKKLVIICPLSCNANGSLDGKGGNIKCEGTLRGIQDDEGGNNNRHLKTNVYKLCEPFVSYIAAEIPSPLATLYEMRDVMDAIVLEYHRKCFVETLKDLLKSYQCIMLEYDDLNSPEPLHSFLLSKLQDGKIKSLSV
ncbi:hypothetical protein HNY73_016060 [Argiope bruennichi]|uniref:STING ligand-binding domain-containing protein n=2 Tax=Argiope bruennichi TaxID=94029 RepID=A0A8T0EIP7_ARGBR|nr:hypothetical protein HNY73_016060 [Argiope bruennichi]